MSSSLHQRIYEMVRHIPFGRVAAYGEVASLAGLPGHARLVGYALHNLPDDSDVPWHRVVNAGGGISLDREYGAGTLQRSLLEAEGIRFDSHGKIDLSAFGWDGEGSADANKQGV
ncbi:MGMT family protein [Candidatus Neomarinimicrobiota bacterium]